jgi:hypothetical protein
MMALMTGLALGLFPQAGTAWAADPSFAPHVDYPAGGGPEWVAVGDLDGDGDLDLTTANFGTDAVSVLLGNGDGTFAPQVTYPAGDGPVSVAVGDLDGDGDLDLTSANTGGSVSVLLNTVAFIAIATDPTGAIAQSEPVTVTIKRRHRPHEERPHRSLDTTAPGVLEGGVPR